MGFSIVCRNELDDNLFAGAIQQLRKERDVGGVIFQSSQVFESLLWTIDRCGVGEETGMRIIRSC